MAFSTDNPHKNRGKQRGVPPLSVKAPSSPFQTPHTQGQLWDRPITSAVSQAGGCHEQCLYCQALLKGVSKESLLLLALRLWKAHTFIPPSLSSSLWESDLFFALISLPWALLKLDLMLMEVATVGDYFLFTTRAEQDPSHTAAKSLTQMLKKVKMFMFPMCEVRNLRNLHLFPHLWLNRWSHCCCLHGFMPKTDSRAEQARAEMRMVCPCSHIVLWFWGAAKAPMNASPRSCSLQAGVASTEARKKAKYPNGRNQGMIGACCSTKAKPNQIKIVSEGNGSTPFAGRKLIDFSYVSMLWTRAGGVPNETLPLLNLQQVSAVAPQLLHTGWLHKEHGRCQHGPGCQEHCSPCGRDFVGSKGLYEESLIFWDSCY